MSKILTQNQLRAYHRDKLKLRDMTCTLKSLRNALGRGVEETDIADFEEGMELMAHKLESMKEDVAETLASIEDPLARQAARLHFLQGLQWGEVAGAMGVTTCSVKAMVNREIRKIVPQK